MARLRTFTLKHNEQRGKWDLCDEKSRRVLKSFGTKAQATKAGVLRRAIGGVDASVRIHKQNGEFAEERTFPSSRDPHRSKG